MKELQDTLGRILCLDEEYFITDSDGIPFDVNEYDNPFRVNEKLKQYEALEAHEKLCVTFLGPEGYEWTYCIDRHEDVTVYPQETLKDVE